MGEVPSGAASGKSNAAALHVTDAIDGRAWDALVRASSDASFCHLHGWRSIIEEVMGHECLYQAAYDRSGRYAGVLPMVRIRNPIFGDHLLSMPFLNYGGAAGSPDARELLTGWAFGEAMRSNADSLLLRTRVAPPGPFTSTSPKVTVVLPLAPTADEMWNNRFTAKFRTKIKRPQRDGMTTRFGPDQLDAYYGIFAENMRDLGTPVLPRQFFERIITTFPELVVLGVTYWNDRPVASGLGFIWRGEFEMTWSSSLKELRAQKPNMLLYWDYMSELIGRGVQTFNFGRSTPGSGPHEFKQSWGGIDEPLPWIQWPDATGGSGDSRAAQLASSVWQHVPLSMANAMGPWLARQLPWW